MKALNSSRHDYKIYEKAVESFGVVRKELEQPGIQLKLGTENKYDFFPTYEGKGSDKNEHSYSKDFGVWRNLRERSRFSVKPYSNLKRV